MSEGIVTGSLKTPSFLAELVIESSEALPQACASTLEAMAKARLRVHTEEPMDKMSNSAKMDFPLIMQLFVEEHGKHFVDAFFNKAGNLSLKQHAFELLAGIGNKKALQMAELRGSSGFSSMQELNENVALILLNFWHVDSFLKSKIGRFNLASSTTCSR